MTPIKRANADAAIALLAELFPKTFAVHEARRRPLKIGIRDDIIATVRGAIAPHELAAALRRYCNNTVYQSHLRAGVARIDLDGNPAGIVTPEEAAKAAEELGTHLLKAAARRRAKQQEPPRKPVPEAAPGPKRLTLSDLKQIAVMRRQADVRTAQRND